jgi:hypothetical protein
MPDTGPWTSWTPRVLARVGSRCGFADIGAGLDDTSSDT